MDDKTRQSKTLGPVSARFIEALQSKRIFTIEDAIKVYGRDRQVTITFLNKLVKRGILFRIKAGVYLILQMGQESAQLSNWPVIARELAGSNNYYLSHYSAMRFHGMTTHPLNEVYITMFKRCNARKINEVTYRFIYSKQEHFWGEQRYWVTKQDKVYLSDIERTLLDGFARPDLCGGIKEVVRAVWQKHTEIDWEKMLDYSERYYSKAAVKRLGFIIELLGFSNEGVVQLLNVIAEAKDYIFLDPNGSKKGKSLSRWRIRINMNLDELKASVWE